MKTLEQAIIAVEKGRLKPQLGGLPVGDWPETRQAIRELKSELPPLGRGKDCRNYAVSELIDALYDEVNDRYVRKHI